MTWEVVKKLSAAPNLFFPQQVLKEIGSHAQGGWQQLLCLTQNFWLTTAVLKMGYSICRCAVEAVQKNSCASKVHKKYPQNILLQNSWEGVVYWIGFLSANGLGLPSIPQLTELVASACGFHVCSAAVRSSCKDTDHMLMLVLRPGGKCCSRSSSLGRSRHKRPNFSKLHIKRCLFR